MSAADELVNALGAAIVDKMTPALIDSTQQIMRDAMMVAAEATGVQPEDPVALFALGLTMGANADRDPIIMSAAVLYVTLSKRGMIR